jgi:hypothetical protein
MLKFNLQVYIENGSSLSLDKQLCWYQHHSSSWSHITIFCVEKPKHLFFFLTEGFANQKHFLLFIFYAILSMAHGLVLLSIRVYKLVQVLGKVRVVYQRMTHLWVLVSDCCLCFSSFRKICHNLEAMNSLHLASCSLSSFLLDLVCYFFSVFKYVWFWEISQQLNTNNVNLFAQKLNLKER